MVEGGAIVSWVQISCFVSWEGLWKWTVVMAIPANELGAAELFSDREFG